MTLAKMRDDIWWAGAHVLTIASHIVLGLAGALYFIAISPFPKEGGPQFGEEFDYIKKFWLAIGMGMLGTMMNLHYYSKLHILKQPVALDYPRQLYHKRQVALLGGVVVLLLCCAGDLGLAITHSAAYRETGYASFTVMKVIAGFACSSCVVAFVADISKFVSQWRPDMRDALQLEENQADGPGDDEVTG